MIAAEPLRLCVPLEFPWPLGPAGASVTSLEMCLVRLSSGDHTAYGEALVTEPEYLADTLDFFADLLTAADPRDYALLWQRLAWALRDHQPEPRADFAGVLSAVDMALWDLAGKSLSLPCGTLLGGRRARRVDCFAAGLWVGMERLSHQAKALREAYGAVQLRLSGDPERDVAAARQVRQVLGDETPLRLDAAGGYADVGAVLNLAQGLEPLEPFWLQDPLPPGDWQGLTQLRHQLPLAVVGGRALDSPQAAARSLFEGAYDVLTPDARRLGGLTGLRRCAELAWTHGSAVSCGGAFSPLTQLVSAHLSAATLHAGPLEVEGLESSLGEMLTPTPVYQDGFLVLPSGPGLGAQVSDAFISRYRVELPDS